MQRARSFSLLVALALVFALGAVPANAATRTVAPPGNSGVSQYLESIPTAGGGQPSNTVHSHAPGGGASGGGPGSSGSGGGPGGGTAGGSGGSGPTGSAGGSIPTSTLRALRAQGKTGAAAAALAAATSPSRAKSAP